MAKTNKKTSSAVPIRSALVSGHMGCNRAWIKLWTMDDVPINTLILIAMFLYSPGQKRVPDPWNYMVEISRSLHKICFWMFLISSLPGGQTWTNRFEHRPPTSKRQGHQVIVDHGLVPLRMSLPQIVDQRAAGSWSHWFWGESTHTGPKNEAYLWT